MTEIERERDFLLRVLELGHHDEPTPLLDEALALLVEMSGAEHGYIEIEGVAGDARARFSATRGTLDVNEVRLALSGTIMQAARQTGEVIVTAVATLDPRFAGASSVRAMGIDAVVCAPIGTIGVVYLQGPRGGRKFDPHVGRLCGLLARHIAPGAAALARRASRRNDATVNVRSKLKGSEAIIGKSAALAEMLKRASVAAGVDLTLLINGPTGSGKTTLARLIAQNGTRADRPFVALNCANLGGELAENELFGAARGSHSTAHARTEGKVHAAEGGTLFLDEIAELDPTVQAKLLKLIEEKTYTPLGDAHPRTANIRIMAATHADLGERVEQGKFRKDLYYRLTRLRVVVPPLEHRRIDIADIAEQELHHLAKQGLPPLKFSEAALRALETADWPGHIRELHNVIGQGAFEAMTNEVGTIEVAHLFPSLAVDDDESSYHAVMRKFQTQFLSDALAAHNGSVGQTATRLGMSRSSLYQLVKTLGLKP